MYLRKLELRIKVYVCATLPGGQNGPSNIFESALDQQHLQIAYLSLIIIRFDLGAGGGLVADEPGADPVAGGFRCVELDGMEDGVVRRVHAGAGRGDEGAVQGGDGGPRGGEGSVISLGEVERAADRAGMRLIAAGMQVHGFDFERGKLQVDSGAHAFNRTPPGHKTPSPVTPPRRGVPAGWGWRRRLVQGATGVAAGDADDGRVAADLVQRVLACCRRL